MTAELRTRAHDIHLVVFDVDGVLTDGRLYFGPDGSEMKVFHVRDGLGIKRLRQAGVEVAVISGRSSPVVEKRMTALDVAHVFQGSDDKLAIYRRLSAALEVPDHRVAYVGDDVIDLPVMAVVGLSIAVRDAHPEVLTAADWVTERPGGHGAAREIADFILDARDGVPDGR